MAVFIEIAKKKKKKNCRIQMEPQNTPDSQSSVKKEQQRWRHHTSSPHHTATGIKTMWC